MNFSKYNYIYEKNNSYFIYNVLSNFFAQIDSDIYLMLQGIKDNKLNLHELNKEVTELFIEKKIFVESDEDEILRLKLIKHLHRFNKDYLSLTIAPTLDCNFNCIYCFEENRPAIYMSENIQEKIFEFIQKMKPKHLYICWYGGEPLLAFNIIEDISRKLKRKKIKFSAEIITNGYLLDKEKIDKLKICNINKIQITIDGTEQTHNIRRPYKIENAPTFNVIVNNIEQLISNFEKWKCQISIRVNIDKDNANEYNLIFQYLNEKFKNKVYIYSGFVQESKSCSSNITCTLNRFEKAMFKINNFKKYKILESGFYPTLSFSECMARQVNSFLIDPNGDMFKCWMDIGVKESSIGNIIDTSKSNDKVLNRYLTGADPFDLDKCRKCFYMPICGGGCPHFAIQNEFENQSFDVCHISKGNLKEFLDIHYNIKESNV